MKIVIGITGKIGAEKSTVTKHISEYPNVHVFDCDAAIDKLYHDDTIQQQINKAFGVHTKDDVRNLLIADQDTTHVTTLNNIFIIPLRNAITQWAKGKIGMVVLDVPTLFENKLNELCDVTIQLSAPFCFRQERVESRSAATSELFNVIDASQWDEDRRERLADHAIYTDGSIKQTMYNVDRLVKPLLPKLTIGIYAGSFDPVTKGHVDIIEKAAALVDVLYVGVGNNPEKKHALPSQTRMDLIDMETEHVDNVNIICYSDALLSATRRCGAKYIIRGLRNEADAISEMNMNGIHQAADPSIQTIFIPADPKFTYVSSSAAKVLYKSYLSHDKKDIVDISWMLSENVILALSRGMINDYLSVNPSTINR